MDEVTSQRFEKELARLDKELRTLRTEYLATTDLLNVLLRHVVNQPNGLDALTELIESQPLFRMHKQSTIEMLQDFEKLKSIQHPQT